MAYEAPTIVEVGTVAGLTQGFKNFTWSQDETYCWWPFGGDGHS